MAHTFSSLALQQARNARTVDLWEGYAPHRAQVMRRMQAAAGLNRRLCVLGAGNCNDLDLGELTQGFSEVVLVDWDHAALVAGATRQLPELPSNLRLVGPIDLTAFLAALQPDAASHSAASDRFLAAPTLPDLSALGAFDLVCSTCVLSQILDAAAQVCREHSRSLDMATALRRQHVELMGSLLKPGGQGILITDFVSSDTAPELLSDAALDLRLLTRKLLQAGNFFRGLHPGQLFLDLPGANLPPGAFGAPAISDPWLWEMGPRRFLVLAATFQRPGDERHPN